VFDVGDAIGDYRILSRLSEGGMATLFRGERRDTPGSAPVAIKVIHEHLSADWQFVRMFVDEALISVRIRHPNVIRVDELGEQDNTYFLAMEYVHGCSLAELLRAMGRQGRRMRPEIAVWIAQQVAAGLHAAHEMKGHDGQLLGVVHRDVSPQNVLLSIDGQVKLLDFGIAKARGRAERTQAGVIKGKIRYMSPEQATGDEPNRKIDIYALGVVLWEMLVMRRFIEAKNEIDVLRAVRRPEAVPPSFRAEGVDPRIDDAVMAALAPDPGRRPPTAEALKRLLEGAVPPGVVGPQHVAELLRVFAGEYLQKAAAALPADLAGPVVEQIRAATPLPGEDPAQPADPVERTRTLTTQVPAVDFAEVTPDTLQEPPTRTSRPERGSSDEMPTVSGEELGLESLDDEGRAETAFDLPRYAAVDEERTVEASGHELASFLERIREDAAASGEGWALPSTGGSPTRPFEEGDLPATRPGNAQSRTQTARVPSITPTPTPASTWLTRILLITLLAFALGAGFAVLWVKLAP